MLRLFAKLERPTGFAESCSSPDHLVFPTTRLFGLCEAGQTKPILTEGSQSPRGSKVLIAWRAACTAGPCIEDDVK